MQAENVLARLEALKLKSAWDRGVREYAEEFLEFLDWEGFLADFTIADVRNLKTMVLNGAKDFREYSYGGNSLIFDGDIAERLSTASELKRSHHGEKEPNPRENWLDVQARALNNAYYTLREAIIEEAQA